MRLPNSQVVDSRHPLLVPAARPEPVQLAEVELVFEIDARQPVDTTLLNEWALSAWMEAVIEDDLRLVREQQDQAALERLAALLPWLPRDPAAEKALKELAQTVDPEQGTPIGRERARREALMVGIFDALQREAELQRVRRGKSYLKDDNGRVALIRPTRDLSPDQYKWWIHKEAVNAAEAYLLGRAYPDTADELDESVLLLSALDETTVVAPLWPDASPAADPEELLLMAEQTAEHQQLLDRIAKMATPAERQVLDTLMDSESIEGAARTLGKAPSTVRVLLHRIRLKARELQDDLPATLEFTPRGVLNAA